MRPYYCNFSSYIQYFVCSNTTALNTNPSLTLPLEEVRNWSLVLLSAVFIYPIIRVIKENEILEHVACMGR
jgi:hypothetical protein